MTTLVMTGSVTVENGGKMMSKYIERNVLEDRIIAEKDAHDIDNPYWVGYHNGLSMAHAITLSMPAADVEVVKHSNWEIIDVDHGHGRKGYHCPECDFEDWRYESTKRCPNCGCKMDLEG